MLSLMQPVYKLEEKIEVYFKIDVLKVAENFYCISRFLLHRCKFSRSIISDDIM